MGWTIKLDAKFGWGEVKSFDVGRLSRRMQELTADGTGRMLNAAKVRLHRAVYALARAAGGRLPCPSSVIVDGQSIETTERGGGGGGFDWHKLVRGTKRHSLVDTLGLPVASRVEPASTPGQKQPRGCLEACAAFARDPYRGGRCRHQSRKLALALRQHNGWRLVITKRGQRAFKIGGLTWIVERSFAWLGRSRRFTKHYEFKVQASETLIDVAATRSCSPDRARTETSLTPTQRGPNNHFETDNLVARSH